MTLSNARNAFVGAAIMVLLSLAAGNGRLVFADANLIKNPSVETASISPSSVPLSWYKGGYGTNTRVLSYPVAGTDGAKALRTEITAYTSGDAKWYFEPVPVSGGQQLTLSDMYRSSIPSTISLQYQLADGTYKYPDLIVGLPAVSTWTPFSKTFTVPTNYASPVVNMTAFHLIQNVGWVETDAFSLTNGTTGTTTGTTTPPGGGGGTGTSTPPSDTTPPSVSLQSVLNQPVSGTITLTASSSDNVGVAGVKFFVDGVQIGSEDATVPYTALWNTASSTNGSHSVTAVAHDAALNWATSTPLAVSVSNTTSTSTGTTTPPTDTIAPVITLQSVLNQPVSGTITLTASSSDNVGVSGVQFFLDGALLGLEDTSSPYTALWNTASSTNGSHTILARARDAAGNSATSSPLTVNISNTTSTSTGGGGTGSTSPSTGALVVTKTVNNTHGGMSTPQNFTLHVLNASSTDIQGSPFPGGTSAFPILSPGSYKVTENPAQGYVLGGFGGNCDANGNVTVIAGATSTCSLTNNDIASGTTTGTTTQSSPNNLIANPSVETAGSGGLPLAWLKGGFGTNTRTLTYPVAGFDGAKALRNEITAYTSGDSKWYFQPVAAKTGDTFTFSDEYRSNIPSGFTIQYQLADGTYKYPDLALNVPASALWTKFTKSFTVPTYASPVANVSIYHFIQAVGWLETDAYDLEGGSGGTGTTTSATTTLTVIKHVINDNGGSSTASNFTLHVKATSTDSVAPFPGSETGTKLTLPAGTYAISEDAKPGYQMTGIAGSCNAAGAITLAAGDNKTCTMTNDDVATTTATTTDPNNLIPNGSLETADPGNPSFPKGWTASKSAGSTVTFSYPAASYDGSRAVKMNITKFTGGYGAEWYFSPIAVAGGSDYRFTVHYNSTASTSVEADFTMQNGTDDYIDMTPLASSGGSWQTMTDTISAPQGATAVTIYEVMQGVGTLSNDDYSLVKLAPGQFGQGMVTLEFDDSLQSQYANALPILQSASTTAGFYIITHYLGTPDYMTQAEVKDLAAKGFEVGAHTRTHPYLTTQTQSQLVSEIDGSKQDLVAMGINPDIFVYPYGDYNNLVENEVKAAGFIASRTVQEGYNTKNENHFELLDQHIENTTTIAQVKSWIDQAKATNTWLIFELHEIVPNTSGDQYAATPAMFQQIVDYIKSSGIKVVTTEQGIGMMNP